MGNRNIFLTIAALLLFLAALVFLFLYEYKSPSFSNSPNDKKLFLRCYGRDDAYKWDVRYDIAVNLNRLSITNGSGADLRVININDALIEAEHSIYFVPVSEIGDFRKDSKLVGRIIIKISRINYSFIAIDAEKKNLITQNNGFILTPTARGSCSLVDGF